MLKSCDICPGVNADLLPGLCRDVRTDDFEYVSCRVDIPIEDQPTGWADVYSVGECLRYAVSTFRADLTGVCGIDGNHYTSGAFSLLREDGTKHIPYCVGNAFIESCLSDCAVGKDMSSVRPLSSLHAVDFRQRCLQYILLKKQQSAECHVLRGGRHVSLCRSVGKERAYLRNTHIGRTSIAMVRDILANVPR